MPPREMTADEVKAEVCWKLKRRRAWGDQYIPVDALVNWIGRLVKDDGDSVRGVINTMVKDGLLVQHKKGKAVSLNTRSKHEIEKLLRDY